MADITLTVVEEQPITLTYVEAAIKPEQVKDVTPTYEAQTVLPDDGMTLGRVNVAAIPDPTEEETFTENGDYNVARIGTAHVDVQPTLDTATVTPTEQTQTVTAGQGYDGLSEVTVNPIPSQYVVPSGSVEITQNGETNVAGKETAIVNVPGIVPSGTKEISITQNGTTTHDVTQYASAEIVTNVNTDPIKGVVYGDYDADGWPHSARFVGMWTEIPSRMFWNFARADGTSSSYGRKITSFPIPQTVVSIGNGCFTNCMSIVDVGTLEYVNSISYAAFDSCFHLGPSIRLKDNVLLGNGTTDGGCFTGCYALKTVTFLGDVAKIPALCFNNCTNIELYDFSNCTEIPALFAASSVQHKSGCVFRIPAALSDTTLGTGNGWESATNWNALTNIVWEVV